MTFWDWFNSPFGVDFQHAIVGLIVAVSAYFSYLAHRRAKQNSQSLEDHVHIVVQLEPVGKIPTEDQPKPD